MNSSFLHTIKIFEILGISLIASMILGPLGIITARKFGLIDIPESSSHKRHKKPTPLAGGMILAGSLMLVALTLNLWGDKQIQAILVSSIVIFTFGLWDDAKGLTALKKILGQVFGSLLLISLGVSVHFIENLDVGFLSQNMAVLFDWVITIFWLVAVTNAFNLVDSMDGLAIGLGGIAYAFFVVVSFVSEQAALSALSAMLLGICIGLYFYNISPAHFFLGDSGSQTLGFILASIAILYNPVGLAQASSWFVPILLLGVPLFDTSLVIFSRLYRRKPIFQSDLGHTYHRLIRLGFNSRKAVLLMHVAALALSCFAIIALSMSLLVSNLIFFLVIIIGFFALIYLGIKPID